MLYTPLPPEGGPAKQERQEVDLSGLSQAMQAKLNQWLAYKKERRENYKPTGLQALVSQIRNSADKYGESAVCALIDNSMSCGYRGIMFDRLGQQRSRKEPTANQGLSSLELEAIQRMMNGG